MKKLICSFLFIFIILNFQSLYSLEKKRDIILKNSSMSFGELPFLKNLSGEINLRKGAILFNNSFSLFDGKGAFFGEYRKKDSINFKFHVQKIRIPYPFGGVLNVSGGGDGPSSSYNSDFEGEFKNLVFYLRNKIETTEIILGNGKIKSSNLHRKEKIDINIEIIGNRINGSFNIKYDKISKKINDGSFEINLENLSLFNTSENIINLGKKIDKLKIVGNIKNNIVNSKILLKSPLLSLLADIKIMENRQINGKIKVNAQRKAIGKKLKIPWFNFLVKEKLTTTIELSGDLKKPKFKIIELK
jgi:hypothetical protein